MTERHSSPPVTERDVEFARLERAFTPRRIRRILTEYGALLDARPPGPPRDADPGPVRHTPTHAPDWESGALERAAVAGAMSWLHARHPRLYTVVWQWYCRDWGSMTAWEIVIVIAREQHLGGQRLLDDVDAGIVALARYLGYTGFPDGGQYDGDPGP